MLPATVIIDVGDLLKRLCEIIAYKQNLPLMTYDTAEEPMNLNVDEYIEMIVDSLVNHTGAIGSLQYLIRLSVNEEFVRMDERIGDVLEAMGILIHNQLAQLRLYEKNDGPLAYFYTSRSEGRGDDWILLTRMNQKMVNGIHEKIDNTLPQTFHSTFKW
jgi:hypothetical protein